MNDSKIYSSGYGLELRALPPRGFLVRRSAGRRRLNERNAESYRILKGTQAMEKDLERIKDNITGGFSMEHLIQRTAEEFKAKSLIIEISTRGIGFSLMSITNKSLHYNLTYQTPPIHLLYRVYLAIYEAKLSALRNREDRPYYESKFESSTVQMIESVSVPQTIQDTIIAIKLVQSEDNVNIPVIIDKISDNDEFIPCPNSVMFSNLQSVITSLSSSDTPLEYREHFERQNCIPACIWKDHLITNPEDIIPRNYGKEQLCSELRIVDQYTRFMKNNNLCFSSWNFPNSWVFGFGPSEHTYTKLMDGVKTRLINNNMLDLRLPSLLDGECLDTYCHRAFAIGNVVEFQYLSTPSKSTSIWNHVDTSFDTKCTAEWSEVAYAT